MPTARNARIRSQVKIAGVYTTIRGINSLDLPPVTAEMADSSSFENDGYASNETVAGSWSASLGIWRRKDDVGAYFSEHEAIRLAAFGLFNGVNRLDYRFYDKDGGPEAWQGFAYTTWKQEAGDWKGLQKVTVTLAGDGPLVIISNPAIASQIPNAVSALPTAQTAGNQITIRGDHFTGTTGLTVGGVAVGAGKFTVVDDYTIIATIPAGSAGLAPIVVTNAAGAGNSLAYTRGA